ncbi:MAG: protein kinase [Sporomusaceae bacterium]|nr:protein kinase [Sporomusaceae bacterium]
MDETRARRMSEELIGKSIGKWKIIEYINNGKSALVFKGMFRKKIGAVKIFDPELIERFGKGTQLERIQRELLLRGKKHDNLISIIDGGECSATGHLFVVMNYLNMPSLDSVIKNVPNENIRKIISQIASAAQYLESLNLCHRDIKPSNIAITPDYKKAILLDLGVLRPIGNSNLTDGNARQFIGTLRYSSPEFLMRTEKDSIDGWRAVTFYQIGAVLHDLIMRKPLFDEYSDPFAKLVNAVQNITPNINANTAEISPDLIHLASTCLIKNPEVRLQFLRWENFSQTEQSSQSIDAIKERIRQRHLAAQSDRFGQLKESETRRRLQLKEQILEKLERIIRSVCSRKHNFPPMEVRTSAQQLIVIFPPSSPHQLSASLYLCINMELLDFDTKAISLSYWSSVIKEGIAMPTVPEKNCSPLFSGVYLESIIKDKMEKFLYLSLDAAQQLKSKSDVERIGPFSEI